MSNTKTLQPFKAGNDPRRNTKGRPPGMSDFKYKLIQEVQKKVVVNGKKMTVEQELLMRLIMEARKGKMWAYKLYMNYIYGRPSQPCSSCQRTFRFAHLLEKDMKLKPKIDKALMEYLDENKRSKK
jgi:hypothetical protein